MENQLIKGLLTMVQARLQMLQHYEVREIAHSINNRINTLTLGMAVLEQSNSPDVRVIASALKTELRDLETLINQLKHQS